MSPILIAGMTIVNFALICYSIGIITEQRRHQISKFVITFLTLGVVFDIVATGCMIIGSSRGAFTAHGFLGYSSLLGMLIETAWAWKHRLSSGNAPVSQSLHWYSRVAYVWWVLAYVTGAALIMVR